MQFCSSGYGKYVINLERMQKRFIKMLPRLEGLSYKKRLECFSPGVQEAELPPYKGIQNQEWNGEAECSPSISQGRRGQLEDIALM